MAGLHKILTDQKTFEPNCHFPCNNKDVSCVDFQTDQGGSTIDTTLSTNEKTLPSHKNSSDENSAKENPWEVVSLSSEEFEDDRELQKIFGQQKDAIFLGI